MGSGDSLPVGSTCSKQGSRKIPNGKWRLVKVVRISTRNGYLSENTQWEVATETGGQRPPVSNLSENTQWEVATSFLKHAINQPPFVGKYPMGSGDTAFMMIRVSGKLLVGKYPMGSGDEIKHRGLYSAIALSENTQWEVATLGTGLGPVYYSTSRKIPNGKWRPYWRASVFYLFPSLY